MNAQITIQYNIDNNEYRVPGIVPTEAAAIYTDDKQDAIDTARLIYGDDVTIKIRRIRAA